ncbi:hypothetical protein BDQ17DRAFT_1302996 [Cyathus striatus]|nr:hypothetical protein BDQ17DRAFT_1302996 [Cyathus striatus]
MALSSSPRKVVPLASGDQPKSRSTAPSSISTRRAFYCGVVVEGSENGRRLPEEIEELVQSLGSRMSSQSFSEILSTTSTSSFADPDRTAKRKRAMTDTSALTSVITELVTSERSYVKRLQILKNDYADPLRNFARNKDTAIIPLYEAKTLFGNIDNLLPVNEAFLVDLEKMLGPNGERTVGGVGDVALRHFKVHKGFELYKQYYIKREEAQSIFEREASKRSSRFGSYIDHIKYQSTDPKNRIGLRELLMEPVQRIPRYTLLFRTMLKHMGPDDPQRAKVVEADEIASKIAQAEADEQTQRATIFSCLNATIDGFPPGLFSNSRRFIDCIDVEDILTDAPLLSTTSSSNLSSSSLHCTLFLFDDKLVIVKRPGNGEKGGRTLTGLDQLDKLTKTGGIPSSKKKSGMSCKGVIDIMDVVATDVGGADINLYLENPPLDQSERWSGRPFRSLSVVNPPMPVNMDPLQTEGDKRRFLENIWHIQAMYRARTGQSVVLCADEQEVECRNGRTTFARTYFNVYQRTAFLQEQKKTKIVVHIDPLGSADPIPFGIDGPPFVRVRVHPMAGGLCRYSVMSSDPEDDSEEDIVQTERVPSRIVQTIHQFGLFQFKTGKNSIPSTPTARSRVAIFGLDAISRNLFSTRPGSSVGDFFAGSISGHRRTKSTTSRSSIYTQTTTTGDGSLTKFSQRSGSTVTVATSVDDDDDASFFGSRSSRSYSITKRAKSPFASDSEKSSLGFGSRSRSQSHSRPGSRTGYSEFSDAEEEEEEGTILASAPEVDSSDYDLALQLELARKNSMNQHEKQTLNIDIPVEETIYEDEPPQTVLSIPRAYQEPSPLRSTSPDGLREFQSRSRSLSVNSGDHRLLGPRSPSPLPSRSSMGSSSLMSSFQHNRSIENVGCESQDPVTPMVSPSTSSIPFSRPRGSASLSSLADMTPKPHSSSSNSASTLIGPLSIKKKTSLYTSTMISSSPVRKLYNQDSPLSRPMRHQPTLPQEMSPDSLKPKSSNDNLPGYGKKEEVNRNLLFMALSTKEDIECCRRSVKRIKVEVDTLLTQSLGDELRYSRASSPEKGLRSPQPTAPLTKAAQERLEEMRNLIAKRQTDTGTPKRKFPSTDFDTPKSTSSSNIDSFIRSVNLLITQADNDIIRALSSHEALEIELSQVTSELQEKSVEITKMKSDIKNSKRQCELIKSLLADATAEKEIMYEAFNEELDGMYNDANLPENEAWKALSTDLRLTKERRNALNKENSELKLKLAKLELQHEEWRDLLHTNGLI